jgi:hypothetical protein
MKRIFAVLAAGFLAACGRTDQVAGGGSDQPNKIGAGRILTASGIPAGGVRVQSWAGVYDPQYSNRIAKVLDSGVSDSSGNWKLHVPDTGSWFVVGHTDGYIAVSRKGDSEARLQAAAYYHGTIQAGTGLTLDAVWLGGSSGPLALDANGNFSVYTEPGPQRIWARLRWATGIDTVLVKDRYLTQGDNSDSSLVADTGNVLLASSESSPLCSALRGVDFPSDDSDAAEWYTSTDQYLSGTSQVQPLGFPSMDSALVNDVGGRYFSWQIQLGSPISLKNGDVWQPFAGIGLQLSRRDLDWSGVRYLMLVVRGATQGPQKINIQLNTSVASRLEPGSQFQYTVNLPTTWTTVLIPLDSMKPPAGSQADSSHLTWKDVRGGVRDLIFYANNQVVRLELREVRAIGNNVSRW